LKLIIFSSSKLARPSLLQGESWQQQQPTFSTTTISQVTESSEVTSDENARSQEHITISVSSLLNKRTREDDQYV
jgi:hypothetical protein